MKLCVIMEKNKEYDVYTFKGSNDKRFFVLIQLLSNDFEPGSLINWLTDDKKTIKTSEWIYMRKENHIIALYDTSASMDETYTGEYLDPAKRFEITQKNFAEILLEWEKLRVLKPDIILIVIHEDNHVSLETDPIIIKQYQDTSYAFDINKK